MSAFVVSTRHIDYLVAAITKFDSSRYLFSGTGIDPYNPDEIGACLLAENVTSVRSRYPDFAYDELPGPIPTPAAIDYQYRAVALDHITPVQTLKALDCYEYQSCEHEGWKASTAYTISQRLREAVIGKLPGYDDASWEIDSAPSPFDRPVQRIA